MIYWVEVLERNSSSFLIISSEYNVQIIRHELAFPINGGRV